MGGYNTNDSLSSAELYDSATGTWTATGRLTTARSYHTATLLSNGKVLVAGGYKSTSPYYLSDAELYDPATGMWTATGRLTTARFDHTATLLPNGKVLVTGGHYGAYNGVYLSSAELYDVATGTWAATGALTTACAWHTATLLPNGRVLVVGGAYYDSTLWVTVYLSSTELYDPATGKWTMADALATARAYHTATLLPNGNVLVAGGDNSNALSSAESYDQATVAWTPTGSMGTARGESPTTTLLLNGKVLVTGGMGYVGYSWYHISSAELYNPATGTWMTTGPMNIARSDHTATLLPNGRVLVVGGQTTDYSPIANSELNNPTTGTWAATGMLATGRAGHTATLLPNGKVLVAGGYSGANDYPLGSAELYDPATETWMATGALNTVRYYHTATLLPNGRVLVVGGSYYDSSLRVIVYLSSTELYDPATGTWTATGPLGTARARHTVTLLPSGKVLVAGGGGRQQCSFQRAVVQSGHRDMDGDWSIDHRPRFSHGELAAQRKSAAGGRLLYD